VIKTLLPAAALALTLLTPAPAQAKKIAVVLPAGAPPIISDFHSRIGVNKKRRPSRHQGIDIGGPSGQPVIAAAPGVVLETDVGSCWGPTIVINHGPGRDGKPLIIAYGHLGDMLVKRGQKVKRGEKIARLGDNADTFRCISGVRHLHLQVGRKHRSGAKGSYWGHVRYLTDGKQGVNPHLYWADGPGKVTCYRPGRTYPKGTLTYPVPCR
jgi:murein DD-endopeptidase MepM/ murein hydrolase activator NlpD